MGERAEPDERCTVGAVATPRSRPGVAGAGAGGGVVPRSPYIDLLDADLARALNRAAGALERPLPVGREAEYRERLRLHGP